MHDEAVAEGVVNRDSDFGAFANPDDRTRNLQRPAIDRECLHDDPRIAVAIRMPDPETSVETHGQDAIGHRHAGRAVVVDDDALRRSAERSGLRRLRVERSRGHRKTHHERNRCT